MRVDRSSVARWVEGYERAWRTAGTAGLAQLFTDDATYVPSPWAAPIVGLDRLAAFWDQERDGPEEAFTLTSEIVAVDGEVAVVRLQVDYASDDVRQWRDLWVLRFAPDGRCRSFEEWPFAPDQRDGHEPSSS
jgi:ketosteroid isomerase-like protein